MLCHELNKSQDRSFRQFVFHLGSFIVIDNSLKILKLEELVINKGIDELFLDLRHIILNQDFDLLRVKTNHVLDFTLNAIC